jgi:hypothetical protein
MIDEVQYDLVVELLGRDAFVEASIIQTRNGRSALWEIGVEGSDSYAVRRLGHGATFTQALEMVQAGQRFR